ncbi:MAG: ribbon-helix-helix domain-containing protein [Candidatus Taylorbacteria bacterium]|nr:ribbon-helix-helix domain-containing protein [Candidatus Taylorbacteria bacterium]
MRNIINISMPASLKKEVDSYVKEGQYSSVSEFFRDILRTWKRNNLLSELRASQNDFEKGKYKVLKSFKDLR